ncbi:hypothetical protein [Aliikangiella sp. IMCC44359]|uniref:hypothetical protein n=1 Tax=Aliikangiella sp. IMCC44359 TaxID=3459125 RepID=UPI00403B08EA
MKTLKVILATSLVAVFTFGYANAAKLDLETSKTLNLKVAGIEVFEIDAGAGFLKIEGSSEVEQISVVADLKVNSESYRLTLDKSGNTAKLIADANTRNSSWFGNSPKIDLTIKVPTNLALNINDGSGSLYGENLLGKIVINDGSGGIKLSNVGELTINDGSGKIKITQANSNVKITDGSGGIKLSNINGSVSLVDGSGGIKIKQVKGHVTISDGSGGIELDSLESGVTILESGSGGLTMNNVKGEVVTR